MELCGKPIDGEIELINKYTRRRLEENEVYVFSVVLCDNDIDRDFERFSVDALKELEKLFVGVSGVLDHEPKSKNQTTRIFSCHTEKVENKLTSDGMPYYRLCARAYIPRSEGNNEFILALDSGIKKEVSVGCAVEKRICSVCGDDIYSCSHIKGRYYNGKLCYATLTEPTDAYEWSFVAVPAQKKAGVIKSYKNGGNQNIMTDIEKRLLSGGEQTFTADEMKSLAEKFRLLKEKANDGEAYRCQLMHDVRKYTAAVLPEISGDTLESITKSAGIEQLQELCNVLKKKAAESIPIKPQLFKSDNSQKINNSIYKNI